MFGKPLTRDALGQRTGDPDRIVGWELVTLADGPGRGVRLLQGRTGGGLSFRIAVDRGFDVVAAAYNGVQVGWQSAAGIQNPALHATELEGGLGLLRSFTGLLATCGLDHFGGPEAGSAAHFIYPYRDSVTYPLHSRISQIPAHLAGHGVAWNERGDAGTVWCEGVVRQAVVFGEVLELRRRVEAAIGGTTVTLRDVVTNRGARPTPHMMLYHYNFGYPLLDEGAEFLAPVHDVVRTVHEDLRAQGVGYREMAPPNADFGEQVYQHAVAADADGVAPAALINPALGLAAAVEFRPAELPVLAQWQSLQAGVYALGIEPCTNHLLGRASAEERGELIWLAAGESRSYTTAVAIHAGEAAIAALRDRITTLHDPVENFPIATGHFAKLR